MHFRIAPKKNEDTRHDGHPNELSKSSRCEARMKREMSRISIRRMNTGIRNNADGSFGKLVTLFLGVCEALTPPPPQIPVQFPEAQGA